MKRSIFALVLFLPSLAWANACVAASTGINNFQTPAAWGSTCGGTYPHVGDTCSITGTSQITIPVGETDIVGTDVAASTGCNVNGASASLNILGNLTVYGKLTQGPIVGSSITGTNANLVVGSLLGNSFSVGPTTYTTPPLAISLTGGTVTIPNLVQATSVTCSGTTCTFTVPSTAGFSTLTPIFTDSFTNIFLNGAAATPPTALCTPSAVTSTTITCTVTGASSLNPMPDTGFIALGPGYYFGFASTGISYNISLSNVKLLHCGQLTNPCIGANQVTLNNVYMSSVGAWLYWAAKANGDDFQIINPTFVSNTKSSQTYGIDFLDNGFAPAAAVPAGCTVLTNPSCVPPRLVRHGVFYNGYQYASGSTTHYITATISGMTWDHNTILTGQAFSLSSAQVGRVNWLHNVVGRNMKVFLNVSNSAVTGTSGNYVVTLTTSSSAAIPMDPIGNQAITIGGTTNCGGSLNSTFNTTTGTTTTMVFNSTAASCTSSQPETGWLTYFPYNEGYQGFVFPYSGLVFSGGGIIGQGNVTPRKNHGIEEVGTLANGTSSCSITSGSPGSAVVTFPGTNPLKVPVIGDNYWFIGFTTSTTTGCGQLNAIPLILTAYTTGTQQVTFSGNFANSTVGTVTDTGGQVMRDVAPNVVSNFIWEGAPVVANGTIPPNIYDTWVPGLISYYHNILTIDRGGNPTIYYDLNGSGFFAENTMMDHNTTDNATVTTSANYNTMSYDFERGGAGAFRMASVTGSLYSRWISLHNTFIAGTAPGASPQYASTNINANGCVFTVAGSIAGQQTLALSGCSNSVGTCDGIQTNCFPAAPAAGMHNLKACNFLNGMHLIPKPGWTSTGFPASPMPPDYPLAPVGACTENSSTAIIIPGYDMDQNWFDQQLSQSAISLKTMWNPTANHSGTPAIYPTNLAGFKGGASYAITSAGNSYAVMSGGLPPGIVVGDTAGNTSLGSAGVWAPVECIGNACTGGCSGQGANCVEFKNASTTCPPTCNSDGSNGGVGLGTIASGGLNKLAVLTPVQVPASALGRDYGSVGNGGSEVFDVPMNYRDNTCTTAGFDAMGGGPGTVIDFLIQLGEVNGYDPTKLDGTTATPNPFFTIYNWERRMAWCFTSTNPILYNASDVNTLMPYGSMSPGALPVFNVAAIQ